MKLNRTTTTTTPTEEIKAIQAQIEELKAKPTKSQEEKLEKYAVIANLEHDIYIERLRNAGIIKTAKGDKK